MSEDLVNAIPSKLDRDASDNFQESSGDTNISQATTTVVPPSTANNYRWVTSPINSIPAEIIRQIFVLCVAPFALRIPAQYPLPIELAPWNLLLVCSKWRQVALGTSALWNDIYTYGCPKLPILKSILSRTGISLISLHIHVQLAPSNRRRGLTLKTLCEQIGDIIQPYVGRFSYLSLYPAEEFRRFSDLPCGRMENLQSVSLDFSDGETKYTLDYSDAYHYPLYPVTAFNNARNLREVKILTEFALFRPNDFPLPWEQLTVLHLINTPIPFTEGHEALRQCLNLAAATLTIPSDKRCLPPGPSRTTLLPHLTSLEIRSATESAIATFGQFLQPFVLPSLKKLMIITLHITRDTWSHSALFSLITRSSCHLECFEAEWATPQLLHAFLPAAPSLLRLSFLWSIMEHFTIFHTIFQEMADDILLPNLLGLECNTDSLDDALKMVEARANQTSCLFPCTIINAVIIHGRTEPPYEIPFSIIQQLRAQGIKIVFQYAGRELDDSKW